MKRKLAQFPHLMSDTFLTLNQSTLFYWALSCSSQSKKRKRCKSGGINEWAEAVPDHAKPASGTTYTGHSKSNVPSLVTGTSRSRSSILTNNVTIVSRGMVDSVKAKPAPDSEMVAVLSDGSLSDNNETIGEERLVTVNSPPKGKRQVTSEVSLHLVITL
jgi:hypothetical protein